MKQVEIVDGMGAGTYWFPDADQHMVKEYQGDKTQLDLLEAALPYVKNSGRAIDGGAHIGLFSLCMAQYFEEVVAFEPAKDTYECTIRNTKDMAPILVYNKALGATFSTASLDQDQRWEGNTGGRYLVEGNDFEVIPLDSLNLDDIGLIKLDLEGHELFALKGAEETLLRCKPVLICEEKPRLQKRQGVRANEIGEYMATLGAKPLKKIRRDVIYVFD